MKEVGPTEAAPSLKHDNQRNSDQDIHASNHHAETKIGSESSDWNLGCLADTGLPYAKGIPRLTTRERRIRSCQMYKSVLKKGEAPSGPT